MLYAPHQNHEGELIKATCEENLARVRQILQMPDVADKAHRFGSIVLHYAAMFGHLDLVNFALEIPGVSDNAAEQNNRALGCAAVFGNLDVVNRLLEIQAVKDNAAAENNFALRWAAQNGHLDVVNRLLEIQAVSDNISLVDNLALCLIAQQGSLGVVNRLLQILAIRDIASAENNRALQWATAAGHYDVACSLLSVPAVRAHLEDASWDDFLTFFKQILHRIKEKASLSLQLDENSNVVSTTYERGPLDAEINIIDILRDIGKKRGISATDFNQTELATLEFARLANDSLYFMFSRHSQLTAFMAAAAPQEKPLPFFDPAAPASSSGVPALAMDDAPGEASSSSSIKPARLG